MSVCVTTTSLGQRTAGWVLYLSLDYPRLGLCTTRDTDCRREWVPNALKPE